MTEDGKGPSSEALPVEARRVARGRLKIFLGAAPGVGKTYEMLREARERKAQGYDVVIGLVETHGRPETRALAEGLPSVARRRLSFGGDHVEELDLDALVRRKPQIALVDELAHTNVAGSRHQKRWQDIGELLEAGVDVYTTLSVQHLESLNDVVSQITRVTIRETVPDRVLEQADEIELIDLSPDDLIRRLHEGKVYVPAGVQRSIQHFFGRGNLTALRELAMRTAARRVDADVLDWMRSREVAAPWATQDRFMILVGNGREAEGLVRLGKRMADRRDAPWVVAHVTRKGVAEIAGREALKRALGLAEEFGAEVVTLTGHDLVAEVLAYSADHNVTQLVLGRSHRPWRWLTLRSSLSNALIGRAKGISVTVVTGGRETPLSPRLPRGRFRFSEATQGFAPGVLATALAGGLSWLLARWVGTADLSLIFLTAVLAVAVRYGRGAALFTAVSSFLTFNFFFTKPYFTFEVTSRTNVITIVLFLIVAIVTGQLGARLRSQMLIIRGNNRLTAQLFEFSRRLNAAVGRDDIAWTVQEFLKETAGIPSVVLIASEHALQLVSGGTASPLSAAEEAAAEWALEHDEPAGRGTGTLPSGRYHFLPLRSATHRLGVLGLDLSDEAARQFSIYRTLVFAVRDQASIGLEKQQLVDEIATSRLTAETERLRAALLSSVSHDLRTPLVSIIGAASSLIEMGPRLDAESSRELLGGLMEEAERLNRYVQNLLDMTRLSYGAVKSRFEWHDLAELVGQARQALGRAVAGLAFDLDLPERSLIYTDAFLLRQVLVNLLDNASKHAPPGSTVHISASSPDRDCLLIAVEDEGPGVPPAERERVFDLFYRINKGDRQVAGTGLGLAICRDLVKLLGGSIRLTSGAGGSGARFEMDFAQPRNPEVVQE